MNNEENSTTSKPVEVKGEDGTRFGSFKNNVFQIIIAAVAFYVAFVGVKFILGQIFKPSKQQVIHSAVQYAKEKIPLPSKLDENTTITDIIEEEGKIHYVYKLSGLKEDVSSSSLYNHILPSLCSNKDTRNLLKRDVIMVYTYKGLGDDKNVEISEKDCSSLK